MKTAVARMLQVSPGELTRVLLLLLMGFTMGMFLATVTVASSTLFLSHFVEEESLPRAFLLSGVFGLVVTLIYNILQNKIPFTILAGLSLALVGALTAMLEFGQDLFADINDLYFLGFTLIIPFTFVINLVFWGTFGRLFNTSQAKRLLGTVDAGAMIASFIAYFSIPQILKGLDSVIHLYGISLFSVTLFVLLFIYLSTGHLHKIRSFQDEKKFYRKVSLVGFLRNRYLLYMSGFVMVSMLVMNFIDYSFLNVTTMLLDESYYAEFLSYFEMTVVIFNFLFQTFATERIVKDYGQGAALLINPTLIGAFTLMAVVVGKYFGYYPDDSYFVVFFICVAMGKLFMSSLRDALDNQTLRLYFLPLEQPIRIDVQTKIEGMITALATLLAGALMIFINAFRIFNFFSVIVCILPLTVVWFYIARRLHAGYKSTLQDTLSKVGTTLSATRATENHSVASVLQRAISTGGEEQIRNALGLAEKLDPSLFEGALTDIAQREHGKLKSFAEEKLHMLRSMLEPRFTDVKDLARSAAAASDRQEVIQLSPGQLVRLGKSPEEAERKIAAQLLPANITPDSTLLLIELLRDPSPLVRTTAIYAAKKIKRPETWSSLVDLLSDPVYSSLASDAIVVAGESVLPILESAFHKTGQKEIRMLRIVQIMGKIGGQYAVKLLWRKINFPDKRIASQILYSLRNINYQASGAEVRELTLLLEIEIGKALWNEAALNELPAADAFHYLRDALREELRENHEQLALLLSLLYDPQAVHLVRQNLATEDPDNIAFALELLDQFIDPSLKPRLFPLFDDTSVEEKLQKLQLFYPRETCTPVQVIDYLLNRDLNLTNRWTKACAVHATAFIPEFAITRGLVAQVFNPDKLLQETAAWVLWHKDRAAYESVALRLPEAEQKFLLASITRNRLLDGLNDGFYLRIEMIMQLKRFHHFNSFRSSWMAALAEKIKPIELAAEKSLTFPKEKFDRRLFLVAHGTVRFHENDTYWDLRKGEARKDLLQLDLEPRTTKVEALERSILFVISAQEFIQVLNDHHMMIDELIAQMNKPEEESVS